LAAAIVWSLAIAQKWLKQLTQLKEPRLAGAPSCWKELFARAIHNWSDRKNRSFVPINCVGLSKELLESDLFGHEKGAFTGAHQLKKGKMEIAHGGTVFLDEVGDVSPELQTKLLRFLQEREFERVGGTEAIRVDVRIIAATNRDLYVAMKEGTFREDLYYRLNVVPIKLPPLRERKDDIPELVRFFAIRFAKEAKKPNNEITDTAMAKLMAYDWPGNVRELANVVERAVVLSHGDSIQFDDLGAVPSTEASVAAETLSYHEAVDDHRRNVIIEALTKTQGNRAAAARLLGLERSYLLKLMKTFQIN
jgi:Nif-specific regulatory protein